MKAAILALTLLTLSGCTMLEVAVSYDVVYDLTEAAVDGIRNNSVRPTRPSCRGRTVSEERMPKVKAFCDAQFKDAEARKRCRGICSN